MQLQQGAAGSMGSTGHDLVKAAVGDPTSDRQLHQQHGLSRHCSKVELERLLELIRLAEVAAMS